MADGKQPDRGPDDGPISVNRIGEALVITARQGALETRCEMSEYNAWRVFGCLAVMLGVRLPAKIGKAIKL